MVREVQQCFFRFSLWLDFSKVINAHDSNMRPHLLQEYRSPQVCPLVPQNPSPPSVLCMFCSFVMLSRLSFLPPFLFFCTARKGEKQAGIFCSCLSLSQHREAEQTVSLLHSGWEDAVPSCITLCNLWPSTFLSGITKSLEWPSRLVSLVPVDWHLWRTQCCSYGGPDNALEGILRKESKNSACTVLLPEYDLPVISSPSYREFQGQRVSLDRPFLHLFITVKVW